MRIALVIERMDPSGGGRETSTAQIAEELVVRGHEVTIICQHASWEHPGVTLRMVEVSGGRVARAKAFVTGVQRVMKEDHFDAVLSTLPIPGASVYQPRGGTIPAQAIASQRRRGRVVGALSRWAEPFNRMRRFTGGMEREVMKDSNCRLLAVSEMVRREFVTYYDRHDGEVIFNAVSPPSMDDETRQHERQRMRYMLGLGPNDPVFVCVAKNFLLKGVLEMMSGYADWVHGSPEAARSRLVIIGRDELEGYSRIAGLRHVGKQVVFVPPTDEIERFYAAADVCVLLSWYDPCSRVVLEATSWGVPSITTRYNGAAEVLADGAGIVVDSPRARAQVRDAFATMADVETRESCVEACNAVAGELSIARHVDELETVFEQCRQERT
jgi:UDP-glucose:(heptosyl)LPS alpha-1,3-glucosyltransferase